VRKGFGFYLLYPAIAAPVAIAVLFFFPLREGLVLRRTRTGAALAFIQIGPGVAFDLCYTHSVNRGAVRDSFYVDDRGDIILTASVHQSFGAGMEEGSAETGFVRLTDRGLELDGLKRRLGTLTVAVGSVAGHRLCCDAVGLDLPLADVAAPLSFVTLGFERVSPAVLADIKVYGR
jgi:hypothetical protein